MTGNLVLRKVLMKMGEQTDERFDNVVGVVDSWAGGTVDTYYVVLLVMIP